MRLSVVALLALAVQGCAMPREARAGCVRDFKALLSSPFEVKVEMEATERHVLPVGAGIGFRYDVGRTYPCPSKWKTPLRVTFDWTADVDETQARTTAAHELGHCLGLGHYDDPHEWMFWCQVPGRPLIDRPSPRELAAAMTQTDSYELVFRADVPRKMRDAVEWAAMRWNLYLWRPAFTVRR